MDRRTDPWTAPPRHSTWLAVLLVLALGLIQCRLTACSAPPPAATQASSAAASS